MNINCYLDFVVGTSFEWVRICCDLDSCNVELASNGTSVNCSIRFIQGEHLSVLISEKRIFEMVHKRTLPDFVSDD